MSNRPSSYDALMNHQSPNSECLPVSSPKKQKTLENPNPDSVQLLVDEKIDQLKKKASVRILEGGRESPISIPLSSVDMIVKESGRIAVTEIACNLMRTVIQTTPDDLDAVVYLSANMIAPAHEGVELGIGEASVIKALAEVCGSKEAHIKNQYKFLIHFGSMLRESGKDSQEKEKKNHIKKVLVAAKDCEPQYLVRLLQRKLQIGLAEQTLLASLDQSAVHTQKHSSPLPHIQSPLEEAAKIVKHVYSVLPVYNKIIPSLLSDGVWNLLKTCTFTIGAPVGTMLAKQTKGIFEIVDKFQNMELTCEYKYDGEWAQIHHMEDISVEIYSRNTVKFPDVVLAISILKKSTVRSFVLDCEIVAFDCANQKILPFQTLSKHAYKNVVVSDIKIDHLYKFFEEEAGFLLFATAIISNDIEEIQKFLETAVDTREDDCCNSRCFAVVKALIIKTLDRDATYEPSKQSHNWLKLKKDYMGRIGDSFDLVPIAAVHGCGKRTGVYGAFLLACYDSNNDKFQSICKIGKQLAWEAKAAYLTISPVYCAAVGVINCEKGISLRFPCLLRVREDKNPEQASSAEQVADMYDTQKLSHR
ncbi:DNA ligase, ATP-dependent, N-terminal, partial [Dillenia turbinata]